MKQISIALMQYTQDYDEAYPLKQTEVGNWPVWDQMIYPYIKSTNVYICPSDTASKYTLTSATAGYPTIMVSYSGNGLIFVDPGGAPVYVSKINEPSQKIIVCESTDSYGDAYYEGGNAKASDLAAGLWFNHAGLGNLAFCDGHAKAMKPTMTESTVNMWGYNSNDSPQPCHPANSHDYINCDQVSPTIAAGMVLLEAKYQ